ncbi:N-acetyltransferase, partial [Turicibacter sanguinis]|nr:N-acetyltransferase [Turicibacter sanguinis]
LGARRIVAMCSPLNESSWKLLERIGMRYEGTLLQNVYFKKDEEGKPIWLDTYEYAILKSEWIKQG